MQTWELESEKEATYLLHKYQQRITEKCQCAKNDRSQRSVRNNCFALSTGNFLIWAVLPIPNSLIDEHSSNTA